MSGVDWRSLPLAGDGRSLVEASAGTGKTWTIAMLYLRLLLEEGLAPRQIVVTTFSEAAASELHGRLRQRVRWAHARASNAAFVPDADRSDEAWLHALLQAPAARAEALQRLNVALAELDAAPIGTLHGWCSRIQRQFPFAAGARFEPANIGSGEVLRDRLAFDALRLLRSPMTPEAHALAEVWGARDAPNAKEIADLLSPGNHVPQCEAPALPPRAWANTLRAACDPAFHHARNKGLRNTWLAAADFIEDPALEVPPVEELIRTRDKDYSGFLLKASLNHADVRAAIEISAALHDTLQAIERARVQQAWHAMQQWLLQQKQREQWRSDERSFDDLIGDVHDALLAEAGKPRRPLADAVHAAWPVVLVDEFQDTDSVQFDILDRIYRDAHGVARGRMVMIGDPKQAIYRFRGGDIHAYQRAALQVAKNDRIDLRVNQRSSRNYVAAVNAFFALAGPSLDAREGGSGIAYLDVEASGRRDASPYLQGESPAPALVLHVEDDIVDDQATRKSLALQACANEIQAMLADDTLRIGGNTVMPSDIAVLLPTHHDIETLRRMLGSRGVPCVTLSRQNVFASPIASDLQVILHAIHRADHLPAIRAALATDLFGMTATELFALGEDAAAWHPHASRFAAWRQQWQRSGVLAAVEQLVTYLGAQWLQREDGERLLTDLRHMGEALQAEADVLGGAEELLGWLRRQRAGEGADGEEAARDRQLRIESETRRVQLMTLHASKGLEFPIVFLPLMWAHTPRTKQPRLMALSRDEGVGRDLLADGSAESRVQQEEQDERFRLLYVAMTRAEYACHIHALPPERAANGRTKASAIGTQRSALDVLLTRIKPAWRDQPLPADSEVQWRAGWNTTVLPRLALDAPEAHERVAKPLPDAAPGPLPSRHSFSTLTRGLHAGDAQSERAANDEASTTATDVEPDVITPVLSALAAVRGPAIGNAFHAILEQREPGVALTAQPLLLRECLSHHAGEAAAALAVPVAERLDTVLSTPLGDARIVLAKLPASALRNEMEFHFALGRTSLEALREACHAHGDAGLVPHSQRVIRGLMTGKIDLIFRHDGCFHVLDWKGNWLGATLDAYRGDALDRAMDQSHYRFQALLYTVALDRYLRARLRGYTRQQHLGDAWYLFLRAVGTDAAQPMTGVWRHRFPDGLLDAVSAALPSMEIA